MHTWVGRMIGVGQVEKPPKATVSVLALSNPCQRGKQSLSDDDDIYDN